MSRTDHLDDPTRLRPPARVKRAVAGGVFLATSASLLAFACLPELEPLPEPELMPDGTFVTAPLSVCGDGIIATLDDGGDAGESCDPGEAGAPAQGCERCRVLCDGVLDDASHHCFFDAGTTDSYRAAFLRCDDLGGHVATFASARESAALGGGPHWVGLAQDNTVGGAYLPARTDEPGWPCPGCFARGADAGATALEPYSPDAQAALGCVASVGGRWVAVPCEDGGTPYATICEREPAGRRGQGCGGAICFTLPATAGRKTYVLFASSEEATAAAAMCASYPDGSLALLDTAEEREQLAREALHFLPTEGVATLWIGLSLDDAGAWRWDDGAPVLDRPNPWGLGQPGGGGVGRAFLRMRAGFVDTQLAYSDDKREARRPFVCQRAP